MPIFPCCSSSLNRRAALISLAGLASTFAISAEPAIAQFETVIDVPPDLAPIGGIGSSTQLNVAEGGFVTGLDAGASDGSSANIEVNIRGGTIGVGFQANAGSIVNISGGEVGSSFDANSGSVINIDAGVLGSSFDANSGSIVNLHGGEIGFLSNANTGSLVNISGGSVGDTFSAHSGSLVNIRGGVVGSGFDALPGSVVNISGGTIGDRFDALPGSVVNIRGGTFGDDFDVFGEDVQQGLPGSEVSFFGRAFELGGVPLVGLVPGNALTIPDRDVTLSGILTDGSPFSFELNSLNVFPDPGFATSATLTVTLVPEPSGLVTIVVALALVRLSRER